MKFHLSFPPKFECFLGFVLVPTIGTVWIQGVLNDDEGKCELIHVSPTHCSADVRGVGHSEIKKLAYLQHDAEKTWSAAIPADIWVTCFLFCHDEAMSIQCFALIEFHHLSFSTSNDCKTGPVFTCQFKMCIKTGVANEFNCWNPDAARCTKNVRSTLKICKGNKSCDWTSPSPSPIDTDKYAPNRFKHAALH